MVTKVDRRDLLDGIREENVKFYVTWALAKEMRTRSHVEVLLQSSTPLLVTQRAL